MSTNKSNTLYWTKLTKCARDKENPLLNDDMRTIVDVVDKRFAGKLYDYRSGLLHNKRDQHDFSGTTTLGDFNFHLRFIPSGLALK